MEKVGGIVGLLGSESVTIRCFSSRDGSAGNAVLACASARGELPKARQKLAQSQTLVPKYRFTIEEYSRRFDRRWGAMRSRFKHVHESHSVF